MQLSGDNFPRWELSGGQLSGGNCQGAFVRGTIVLGENCPRSNCLGGNCPVPVLFNVSNNSCLIYHTKIYH